MKLLLVITVLTITASFCTSMQKNGDEFQFGNTFNSTRLKYGSPLIQGNMTPRNCCGAWTIYQVENLPENDKPYHFSKTIRAITNGKLTEEEDIYRKNIDDTTLVQLNILSRWKWNEERIIFSSNMGKIDKRTLNIKAKDYIKEHSKYSEYQWKDLSLSEIDSTLKSWGLSRSDNY